MAYDPTEPTAVDRIRGAIGDTTEPPIMRGGEARYQALLDTLDGDEAIATRKAAAALAAQLAHQPDSLSDAGSTLSWKDRVAQLNRIATGAVNPTASTDVSTAVGAPSGSTRNEATW